MLSVSDLRYAAFAGPVPRLATSALMSTLSFAGLGRNEGSRPPSGLPGTDCSARSASTLKPTAPQEQISGTSQSARAIVEPPYRTNTTSPALFCTAAQSVAICSTLFPDFAVHSMRCGSGSSLSV